MIAFLRAAVAVMAWIFLCLAFMSKGAEISSDLQLLTIAIIAAGALAGGDDK